MEQETGKKYSPEEIRSILAASVLPVPAERKPWARSTEHPNCIAYWHPRLAKAGLPVPRTVLVDAGEWWGNLIDLLDGKTPAELAPVVTGIQVAAQELGLPVFLRTGHTSGKHEWENTCYLAHQDPEIIAQHVAALINYSECVDFFGLPYDWFAVREFLPGQIEFIATEFGNMPVRQEYRCFVRDGELMCSHPYWPADAFRRATANELQQLASISGPAPTEVLVLAAQAGAALGGEWSVDVLATDRGWYVTDCAVASQSFHWPDCPHANRS